MSFGSIVGLYNTKCVGKVVPATRGSKNIFAVLASGRPVPKTAVFPLAVVVGVWVGFSGMICVPSIAN